MFSSKAPDFFETVLDFSVRLVVVSSLSCCAIINKRPPFLILCGDKEGRPYDLEACGASLFNGRDGLMYEVISVAFDGVRRGLSSAYFKLSALARRLSISAL